MKVVVTGGLGYVGGAVCMELLLRGHEVMALDDLSSAVAAEVVPSRNWQQGKIEDDLSGEMLLSRCRRAAGGTSLRALLRRAPRRRGHGQYWGL